MLGLVEVLCRVSVLGRVAASDMSVNQAQAQMHPRISGFRAFFADVFASLTDFNLIEVCTFLWHRYSRYLAQLPNLAQYHSQFWFRCFAEFRERPSPLALSSIDTPE